MHQIKGLYVHVPFCDGKCFYCAFYSLPYEKGLARRYLRALELELKQYPPLNAATIYVGGGTPSLLPLAELQDLCNLIKEHISTATLKEWTVECNPRSLTAEKLLCLAKAGVNRISLGAQSFDDAALKWLGRRHTAADIYDTVQMIKSAGFDNFGIDLIACIPGFGLDLWRDTLQSAVALNPKHISVYALTSEEGSRLARRIAIGRANPPGEPASMPKLDQDRYSSDGSASAVAQGAMADKGTPCPTNFAAIPKRQINLLSDDEELEALDLAEKILADDGYQRYEISNYAQAGFACLHNLSCWRGEEYIGLGPAAASHAGLKRWTNLPDLEKYLAAVENGKKPPHTIDALNENLKQLEKIVFGLRMTEGISEATGKIREKTLHDLSKEGLVLNAGGCWRLTERGFHLADYVGAELLAGAD